MSRNGTGRDACDGTARLVDAALWCLVAGLELRITNVEVKAGIMPPDRDQPKRDSADKAFARIHRRIARAEKKVKWRKAS